MKLVKLMGDLQSFRDVIVTNPTAGYKNPYKTANQ